MCGWPGRRNSHGESSVRFPDETLAAIQSIIGDTEDRSDFIRAAVELATAIRKIDVYDDLKAHLMANETIEDFCAKAVRQAVRRRKATLARDEGDGEAEPAAD